MDKSEVVDLLEARFEKKKQELDEVPDLENRTLHAESSLQGRIAELSTLIYKITGENPTLDKSQKSEVDNQ